MMKMKLFLIATALLIANQTLVAQEHGHDHGDHSHHGHGEHAHGHSDAGEKQAGPNGGKIITETDPHFEIFVQDDRRVRITFLDEEGKAMSVTEPRLSGIGGSRSNPTRMKFEPEGDVYVSNVPLPEGNNVPLILRVQTSSDTRAISERININLNQCPSCEYKEYACICDHGS